MKDAGLNAEEHDPERIGVAVGAGIGGIHTIERTSVIFHEGGQRKISPFFVPSSIVNMAAGKAYNYQCDVPGHAALGMRGAFTPSS